MIAQLAIHNKTLKTSIKYANIWKTNHYTKFMKIQKAISILVKRLREQGIYTSTLWLIGRGIPALTGVPILRFCQVTPHLFVGSQFRKKGFEKITRHGIHAVVNMRIEKDDAALGLAPALYCYLPTVDDEAPSLEHLDQGVRFIDQVIRDGGKVYIHCGAGVGRAPSMAAAYLMWTGKSLDETLALIRKARPFIMITPPQLDQLKRYEERLRLS